MKRRILLAALLAALGCHESPVEGPRDVATNGARWKPRPHAPTSRGAPPAPGRTAAPSQTAPARAPGPMHEPVTPFQLAELRRAALMERSGLSEKVKRRFTSDFAQAARRVHGSFQAAFDRHDRTARDQAMAQ